MKIRRLSALTVLIAGLFSQALADPIVPTSYSFNMAPGYGDDTGSQLKDGVYAGLIPGINLGGDEWVAWDGGTPSITFDFGSVVSINQVSLSMANWTAAAVYLPEDVVIGGTAFTVNPFAYPNLDHALLVFNGSWTGSSLTIDLDSSYNRWIFLDEVTFNEGPAVGHDVPDTSATFSLFAATLAGLAFLRRRV